MGTLQPLIMKAALLLLLAVIRAMGAPDPRFTCSECVDEMHKMAHLVGQKAKDIQNYLIANYCPTVNDQEMCEEDLSRYYIGMLFTFARLWGFVMPGDTPVKSVLKEWSGWKGTW